MGARHFESKVLRPQLLVLAIAIGVAGCEKSARNMYDQPRYKPLAESSLWSDSRASRPPVSNTIAQRVGTLARTASGRRGSLGSDANPSTATSTLGTVQRGRERFDIFCAPCHSETGEGDGMIVRRGFPHPPSFHIDRLRQASDAYLY